MCRNGVTMSFKTRSKDTYNVASNRSPPVQEGSYSLFDMYFHFHDGTRWNLEAHLTAAYRDIRKLLNPHTVLRELPRSEYARRRSPLFALLSERRCRVGYRARG